MFLPYSRDWLTISSGVSVGRCFTETSAAAPGAAPPADGGAIGAGAGPCANTVLAIKVVVSRTFAFTTAPFLSPNTPKESQRNQILINSAGIIGMSTRPVNRHGCANRSDCCELLHTRSVKARAPGYLHIPVSVGPVRFIANYGRCSV